MNCPDPALIARARYLHAQQLAHHDARWPEVARMQRAGLIRVTPLSRHLAELRFVEPPPPDGWIIMAAAPRNGTEGLLLNDEGEHLAHWAEYAAGRHGVTSGWYRAVKGRDGRTLYHELIPGGEPRGWRRP